MKAPGILGIDEQVRLHVLTLLREIRHWHGIPHLAFHLKGILRAVFRA